MTTPFLAEAQELHGSIRSFSEETRDLLHRRIAEVAGGVAMALGATAEVTITRGVDPTVNAAKPTAIVYDVAATALGKDNVDDLRKSDSSLRQHGTFLLL